MVTSGRRTPLGNHEAHGSPTSWHLLGRAVDFSTPNATDLYRALTTARIQRTGPGCTGPEEALVHDAGSGLHLHVAW
jgi:uncharacterized protein YcbK (DUF882 family)